MPLPKITREHQAPPYCLQVELTEGCNLRCNFCGLNGIRGKMNDFKFMTLEVAERLVELMIAERWCPRVEFAMHGEPSANPQMEAIARAFRQGLSARTHLMMTSNGYGFLKDPTTTIDGMLQWLNVLALDWYEGVQIVPKILERYQGQHTPVYYPQDKQGNPHHRRKPAERVLVIVQDIVKATKGTHASVNNHCGCGAPKNDKAAGKRCAKPFRELSIRWDGSVALCCNDWTGIYKCGSILDQALGDIWNGKFFRAARRKLYRGQRDFGPCEGCDALSYRPGLLPDQRGKLTMPAVDQNDLRAIEEACSGDTYTVSVLRPWQVEEKSRLALPVVVHR